MNGTIKKIAIAVILFLALGSASLFPSAEGQGSGNSLLRRVEVLEGMVDSLTKRVEALEAQGPGGNSFDVIHLNLLNDVPSTATNGDFCILPSSWYVGGYMLNCYMYDAWYEVQLPILPRP